LKDSNDMTYILPKAGTGEPLRHMLLDVVEADAVEFLAHRSRCRKRLSTSKFPMFVPSLSW
jgi:hypothetical protein